MRSQSSLTDHTAAWSACSCKRANFIVQNPINEIIVCRVDPIKLYPHQLPSAERKQWVNSSINVKWIKGIMSEMLGKIIQLCLATENAALQFYTSTRTSTRSVPLSRRVQFVANRFEIYHMENLECGAWLNLWPLWAVHDLTFNVFGWMKLEQLTRAKFICLKKRNWVTPKNAYSLFTSMKSISTSKRGFCIIFKATLLTISIWRNHCVSTFNITAVDVQWQIKKSV